MKETKSALSFDEKNEDFIRVEEIKYQIFWEIDEIDRSKADYLQLSMFSTACQRQKFKR